MRTAPVAGSVSRCSREGVPDPLDDPALDLARGAERVDHPADVVDRGDALDGHLARLDVDGDLGDLDAEGEHAASRPGSARARPVPRIWPFPSRPDDLGSGLALAVGEDDRARRRARAPALERRSAGRRARGSGGGRRRRRRAPPAPSRGGSRSRPRASRTGPRSVSPSATVTWASGSPSSSAAIWASAVLMPVPTSWHRGDDGRVPVRADPDPGVARRAAAARTRSARPARRRA